MPRKSKSEIEQVKRDTDLLTEVTNRGIILEKKGKEHVGLCPFHEERTPSFHVNPDKKQWKCFGCGKGGDVIAFIMEFDKKPFPEVVGKQEDNVQQTILSQPAPTNNVAPKSPEHEAIALKVLDYYHQTLKNTPTALAYLKKRGLDHPQMMDHFKIGYVDGSLAKKLLPPASKEEPQRLVLKAWGLLSKDGREFMKGRLVFPIFKQDGGLGEVYGRRIGKERAEFSNHRYLPNAHQGVFNVKAIGKLKTPLIVCECIIDALSLWCHGWQHVTAAFGVDGLNDELIEVAQRQGVESIQIAYDGDEAGNKQADLDAKRLMAKGFIVERILLPLNSDINSYMMAVPDPKATLTELLSQRIRYTLPPETVHGSKPNPVIPTPQTEEPEAPKKQTNPSKLRVEKQGAFISFGARHYCLRGLENCTSLQRLKLQVRLEHKQTVFLDTIDFTANRSRKDFINSAAEEVELEADIIKKDLGKLLLEVEQFVMNKMVEVAEQEDSDKPPPMTQPEIEEALEFLKNPNLFEQILTDFDTVGMVGEEENKLVGYLCAVSRKLSNPLAVLVQSASSAGKTTLMDAILDFVPPEDKVKWTSISGNALYYVDEDHLKHKLLAISEEEGMDEATYALKNLISDKKLQKAVTIKDPKTGQFITQEKEAYGPTGIFLTTTLAEINEELVNRFIRLTIDESKEQTERVHKRQRFAKTLAGWQAETQHQVIRARHHNAQRLLKPLRVFNPYAEQLNFTVDYLRNRRDNQKYLGLIEIIAFLRQYQKESYQAKNGGLIEEYINVDLEDIQQANTLMHQVLGRCLDELAPQTRRLLGLIHTMVMEMAEKEAIEPRQVHFTRKVLRHYTRWSDGQLQIHLKRLETLEYLATHQGARGQAFLYELLWQGEGEDGAPFVMGLKDPNSLKDPNFDFPLASS